MSGVGISYIVISRMSGSSMQGLFNLLLNVTYSVKNCKTILKYKNNEFIIVFRITFAGEQGLKATSLTHLAHSKLG